MKIVPRIKIAHLPTPIESLPRLSTALGGPQILIKRDDQTGLAFGGNKTRKLEFLFAEAQANGARTIITTGAVQSNHCRQTAAAAARFGYDCILILAGEQPDNPSGNLLLDRLFNTEIIWTDLENRDLVLKETFNAAWEEGRRPYLVPYGGSSPIGAMGYVHAMEELVSQNAAVDWIVFPSSSGGTQAGMLLGARMFGYKGKILGISVDEPQKVIQEQVTSLANEMAVTVGEGLVFSPDEVLVNSEYCKLGYGVLTEAERDAMRAMARFEGIVVDPVYTGRAAAGMIDLIKTGFFKKNETVLFWHTGGTPALFADKYEQEILKKA